MRISSHIFSRKTPRVGVCMAFNLLTISEEADWGIFVEHYVASVSCNKAFQHHIPTFDPVAQDD